MGDAKKGMLKDTANMFKLNYVNYFSPYFKFLGEDMNRLREMFGRNEASHERFILILQNMINNLPDEEILKKQGVKAQSRKRPRANPSLRHSDMIRGDFRNGKELRIATEGSNQRGRKRRRLSMDEKDKAKEVDDYVDDDDDEDEDDEERKFWLS